MRKVVFTRVLRRFAFQLNERLQTHLRIAQIGDQPSDLAHTAILPRMPILADFARGKTHRCAQLLKVLSNFVDCDAALLRRVQAQLESRFNLFAKNPLQSVRQRFAQFQTEAHKVFCLFVGQSHVAVTFLSSHFPSKPGGRLEFSAADAVREFHFRYHETSVSPLININLNNQIFPGNFAAHLAQSSTGRSRPKRVELFWTEPDLAFFPVCPAAHLESQRCSRAYFAETDLSACGFTRQITLIDNVAPRAIQFIRQSVKQKFAFNFPIICCSSIFLHKANMLNATGLLSRFSRCSDRVKTAEAVPSDIGVSHPAEAGCE